MNKQKFNILTTYSVAINLLFAARHYFTTILVNKTKILFYSYAEKDIYWKEDILLIQLECHEVFLIALVYNVSRYLIG